ncbi:MAG TPA: PEGA domain-containing protein, partial [Vicinamibacterales bacterium]|nr:PEGA domain-containing protein [Vicinamibacterales bacterium]
GGVASLVVPLAAAAGWVSISSPVELQLFEGDTLVGSSRIDRVMLSAGEHRLRLVNADIGFETEATVRVQPGAVARREVAVPNGAISVNAIPWAEVFIDGARIGETPIANHAVAPGWHEVILRNPKFPEQRRVVTVSLKAPARLGVDMRQ